MESARDGRKQLAGLVFALIYAYQLQWSPPGMGGNSQTGRGCAAGTPAASMESARDGRKQPTGRRTDGRRDEPASMESARDGRKQNSPAVKRPDLDKMASMESARDGRKQGS